MKYTLDFILSRKSISDKNLKSSLWKFTSDQDGGITFKEEGTYRLWVVGGKSYQETVTLYPLKGVLAQDIL